MSIKYETVGKFISKGSSLSINHRERTQRGMGKKFPHAVGVTAKRSEAPEGQSPYGERSRRRSDKGGDAYYVKRRLDTGELSCNCKGWICLTHCKHVDYMILNPCIELTDIPTHQEAVRMDWGRNLEEKEKWTVKHLKTIEL